MYMKHKAIVEEIKKIDPLLHCPSQNLEQNLADGIEELVPDPDDIPGGPDAWLTQQPNIEEADLTALLQLKIKNLRGK